MAASETRLGSIGRRAVLATAGAAILLACAPRANAGSAPVDLQVVDRETGQPLKVWRHDGRLFVAGAPGDRYGLRVINRTGRRVLVVMSVDGVNILSGETAGYDQGGYIFGPHESYELDGWRKSLSEIADFTFTSLPRSYAALTGRPANVGVIGIAVFDEKVAPVAEAPAPPSDDVDRGEAGRAMTENAPSRLAMREPAAPPPPRNAAGGGDSADSVSELVVTGAKAEPRQSSAAALESRRRDLAEAERREEKLGTGHGERELSVTTLEPFERATPYPRFTQEIAYDTRDNLVAMGVIPAWRYGERQPRPFPSSPAGAGFVPDPPDDR
jgi:hypothetical protein